MKTSVFKDHESVSHSAAQEIVSLVKQNPRLVMCLSTGSTPKLMYSLLQKSADSMPGLFKSVRVITIDEWAGIPENDPCSCDYYLQQHVIKPLDISDSHYLRFRCNAEQPSEECHRIQTELASLGSIDLCILGLGLNGHIAMNEPGKALNPNAHLSELTEEIKQHPMLASKTTKPHHGYTLGISDILSSKRIIMLATGNSKAVQLKRLLTPKIETTFPASFLWLHNNATVFTDLNV